MASSWSQLLDVLHDSVHCTSVLVSILHHKVERIIAFLLIILLLSSTIPNTLTMSIVLPVHNNRYYNSLIVICSTSLCLLYCLRTEFVIQTSLPEQSSGGRQPVGW